VNVKGIVVVSRRAHSVGYFSAYYRGLECLLEMWPYIRQQVPDATLDVYYGWQSWVSMEGEQGRPFYERVTTKLSSLSELGVTEHGRVSHRQLAQAMKETAVWAYPTEFPEIHCITALKAQEAGMWPVVTDVGALAETVVTGDKVAAKNIYSNDYAKSVFANYVVAALNEEKSAPAVPGTDWSDVARQWLGVMR
jgi:glycosyltransferase involved in cell wall biosynthesis